MSSSSSGGAAAAGGGEMARSAATLGGSGRSLDAVAAAGIHGGGGGGGSIHHHNIGGRVVRVHFACRAELPLGSTLRVTGSSLWAPASTSGSFFASPDSSVNVDEINATALGTNSSISSPHNIAEGHDLMSPELINSPYASSVEMVTDPDTYPLWRTRKPVVVVLQPPTQASLQTQQSIRQLSMSEQPSSSSKIDVSDTTMDADALDAPTREQSIHRLGSNISFGGGDDADDQLLERKAHAHRYRYLVVTPGAVGGYSQHIMYLAKHGGGAAGGISSRGVGGTVTGLQSAMAGASVSNTSSAQVSPAASDDEGGGGGAGGGFGGFPLHRRDSDASRDSQASGPGAPPAAGLLALSSSPNLSSSMLSGLPAGGGGGGGSSLGVSPSSGNFGPPLQLSTLAGASSTSNETGDGALPVTLWEDPFGEYTREVVWQMKHPSHPTQRKGGFGTEEQSVHGGHGTRGPAHVHHRAPSEGSSGTFLTGLAGPGGIGAGSSTGLFDVSMSSLPPSQVATPNPSRPSSPKPDRGIGGGDGSPKATTTTNRPGSNIQGVGMFASHHSGISAASGHSSGRFGHGSSTFRSAGGSTGVSPVSAAAAAFKYLVHLPFRTVYIPYDTKDGETILLDSSPSSEMNEDEEGKPPQDEKVYETSEGTKVAIDEWNNPNDPAWKPYREILELTKLHKEQKKLRLQGVLTKTSEEDQEDLDMEMSNDQDDLDEDDDDDDNGDEEYKEGEVDDLMDDDDDDEDSMGDIESAMYGTNAAAGGGDEEVKEGDEEDEGDDADVDEEVPPYDPDDPKTHVKPKKKKKKKKKDSTPRQRLFIVCFHLPVKLSKNELTNHEWHVTWTESLIAKTDNVLSKSKYDVHWLGTVTPPPNIATLTADDRRTIDALLQKMNCTAIYLNPDVKQAHYLGMCKQVLWPMFHNVDLLDLTTSGWGQRDLFFHRQATSENEGDAAAGGISLPVSNLGSQASVSDWDQSRLQAWWEAYQQVNKAFADRLKVTLRKNDTLWIHDYHLSLLPQYVHMNDLEVFKGRRVTKMVMFLHIPFPTSQIFRELECGEQILEGMLHADVIGFHAFDHARHFLNAGKRILGLNYESLVGGLIGMRYNARLVLITLSNVSIEAPKVDRALSLPSMTMDTTLLVERHPHRRVIVGMDVAQRLSGVASKLLAFERLLTDYPLWQSKVVLMQIVNIPNNRQVDELTTVRELRFLVRRIQDQFGPHVIDYQEISGGELSLSKRLPYWRASDVFLSTPIREGLNLLPLEYVYTRHASSGGGTSTNGSNTETGGTNTTGTPGTTSKCQAGVTIVSEFGACSSILNGALRVNPYDIQMVALSIDKALTMSLEEREGRVLRDIEFISTCPSSKWTKNVLRDLQEVTMAVKDASGGLDDDDDDDDDADDDDDDNVNVNVDDSFHALFKHQDSKASASNVNATVEALDSIGSFLQRESDLKFSHVDLHAVRKAYLRTKHRVIIMDFNGTLVVKEPPGKYLKREILGTSGYKPPSSVLRSLTKLAADPNNTVVVVSGDSQENVETAIGTIPNLYIAASNGATFSLPLLPGEQRRTWYSFDLGVDWEAVKQVSLPVLSKYTARTNGSFVKLTHSSIGWSNYSADPEWGAMQASHLVLEMQHVLQKFDVRFVTLKGVVEVVPRRLNKGLIVKKILREVSARNGGDGVDFCICMGDDVSDEKMFASVYSFLSELNEDYNNVIPSPSVMVTPQPNNSGTGVAPPQQQQQLLQNLNRPGIEFLQKETPNLTLKPESRHNPIYAFTVAVGKKPTHASYYVDDARDVAHVLAAMTGDRPTTSTGAGSVSAGRSMSFDAMEEENATSGIDFFS